VLEELGRFCRAGAAARSFELMRETGVFEVVLPEVAPDYASSARAWPLLGDLLRRIDAALVQDGAEPRTGKILAAILMPCLADGPGSGPPRVQEIQEKTDRLLQPLALRLRVPRREQEWCRQVVGTVFRMVPVQSIRPGARRALAGRECFGDALTIVEALGARHGGDFAEAAASWLERTPERPSAAPPERARAPQREDGRPARGGRRRGRGRGRGDAPRGEGQRRATVLKLDTLPPPWDDGYFFAALPSVPDEPGDDLGTGAAAGAGAPAGAPASTPAASPDDAGPEKTGSRRRRRRRRRPRKRTPGASDPAASEPGDPTD
jgi:hypothetical protein